MLGKLIKHEFIATRKITLPVYIILATLTLCANVVLWYQSDILNAIVYGNDMLVTSFISASSFAYVACILMTIFMPWVLAITRFKQNLLSDEGYLSFTLPVSTHEMVLSKLIVTLLWYALGIILVYVSISALMSNWTDDLFTSIFKLYFTSDMAFMSFITLVSAIFTMISSFLLIYLALSMGYSQAKHKFLQSVIVFFVINQVVTMLSTAATTFAVDMSADMALYMPIIINILLSVLYYFGTVYFLENKLNLE